MEVTNRSYKIISMLRNWIEEGSVENVRYYVLKTNFNEWESKTLYANCIKELREIKHLENDEYRKKAISICDYYLHFASGEKYSNSNYINSYRKQNYKQLNVDIPKEIMEEFEYWLKVNNQSKKEFILNAINKYIANNHK